MILEIALNNRQRALHERCIQRSVLVSGGQIKDMHSIHHHKRRAPVTHPPVTFRLSDEDYRRLSGNAAKQNVSVGDLAKTTLLHAMTFWDGNHGSVNEAAMIERESAMARAITMIAMATEHLLSRDADKPLDATDRAHILYVQEQLKVLMEMLRR